MLGIELTEKQKKIWSEMGDHLIATSEIRHLALQYYLQYRQNLQKNKLVIDDVDKISNLVQIAYFISEKNQMTYNMRGERVGGVTFSINQIVKKNNNFQDFIFHMKEMLKVITIEDKFVEQQIENCLKRFKFTMTFHHKFVSTFKKIKPETNQLQLSQSLLWLIFILAKQNMAPQNQHDIIQVTCLIASVFIFYVEECTKTTGIDFQLDDPNYGGLMRKESISHVFLQYFRLKDMAKYQEVFLFFRTQIAQLKDATGFQTFFNDRNIQTVYRKIDSLYMKRMTDANLDERHFLKERINTIMNGNRFTPFGGRRAGPKTKVAHTPTQILSHRVLNYEKEQEEKSKVLDIQDEEQGGTRQNSGSILLKKLAQNKTPAQRTPLIKVTPMTSAMQMYNWVLEKTSYHKYDPSELSRFIKGDEKQLKLINGIWKDICLNQSDKGLELSEPQKLSILALSAEVVYFVTNSNQNLEKLVKDLQLNWFLIWSKIDCILSYDVRMPTAIKIHLLGMETVLISKQLWKEDEFYISIFKDVKCRSQKPDLDRLYRRVIHEIVYQTYFLCKKVNFPEQSMNAIFLLCQCAISENTDLLSHRTLYQIILCSAYAVSKAQDLETSFYSLLVAFKDLNSLGKEDYHELTEQIYLQDRDPIDIITFYNDQFVKKTKPMLIQFKYDSNSTINAMSNRKNLISSPVKDLLPRNVAALGDRTNKSQLQTPMTLALQAYHESPLLKERRIKNLANCVDGKRIMEKKHEMTKEQTLKQTSMLINQKWRNTKSPEKLNTTVKKGNHENVQNL